MHQITLENVGPFQRFVIPIPEDGGIVVVRGDNDIGKTIAGQAVNYLLTGSDKPPVRDGAERGRIEGFGITIELAARSSRRGELEITAIEGKFNIADIIDPQILDPAAADAVSIRTLAQLAGEEPDAAKFHHLLGGKSQFEQIVTVEPGKAKDLLALSETVRRQIHKAALQEETEAETAANRASARLEIANKHPATSEHDETKLAEALKLAITGEKTLKDEAQRRADKIASAKESSRQLAELESTFTGPSIEEATTAVAAAQNALADKEHAVAELNRQMNELNRLMGLAKLEVTHATSTVETAKKSLESIQSHYSGVSNLRGWIDAAVGIEPVAAEELAAAASLVVSTRQAADEGVLIREAIIAADEARRFGLQASKHRSTAAGLRSAADGVDQVLSSVVASLGSELRVHAGRLVTETDRHKSTFFRELSDGARTKIALDIWIRRGGHGSGLVIEQKFWESLDYKRRMYINERLKEVGAVAIAIECDDRKGMPGNLRAEEFTGD